MQFEDLNMWQDSQEIYQKLAQIFNKDIFKDYFFRDQVLRASLSISNNIAE
jgi:four helix bundle protein